MTGAGTPHYTAHVTGSPRPAARVISTPVGAFTAARSLIAIYWNCRSHLKRSKTLTDPIRISRRGPEAIRFY